MRFCRGWFTILSSPAQSKNFSRPVMVLSPALVLLNMSTSTFFIPLTRKRKTKFVVSSSGPCHAYETGLTLKLTLKASEIWCPVSACAFGYQSVASFLFLVGNFQLRKTITISILSGKHKDWFGLEYKLLSFPGAEPPGQFERRLFPLSLFSLVEASEKPFSACSKAVRGDPYFKFHFREANTFFCGSL